MDGSRPKILVVDDVDVNRIILEEILSEKYEIEQAENGMEAISVLLNSIEKPHLMLLDVMMPEMDGFEVLEFMKNEPSLTKIPVIFITAVDDEEKGLVAGAVDYISKPFEPEIVKLRVATHIELNLYRVSLERMVEEKVDELTRTKERFLDTVANLIEYRSMESGEHVSRTRELARILTMELLKDNGPYAKELMENNFPMLVKAVPLHDVGKVGIPDNILLKPGRLTEEEFEIMKTHTTIGGNVIVSLKMTEEDDYYLKHCHDICLHHHEKWDGGGYPYKLFKDAIPLSARIVAVVDVYDALVSERCYKKAMSHDEAMEVLKKSSGSHMDPIVVDAAVKSSDLFRDYEKNKPK